MCFIVSRDIFIRNGAGSFLSIHISCPVSYVTNKQKCVYYYSYTCHLSYTPYARLVTLQMRWWWHCKRHSNKIEYIIRTIITGMKSRNVPLRMLYLIFLQYKSMTMVFHFDSYSYDTQKSITITLITITKYRNC